MKFQPGARVRYASAVAKHVAFTALTAIWAAAWLWGLAAARPFVVLDPVPDVTLPLAVAEGLHRTEALADGTYFVWTQDRARYRLPGLDRRGTWRLDMRLRAARDESLPRPTATVAIDGVAVWHDLVGEPYTEISLVVHESPRAGIVVDLALDPAFVPGGHDRRVLGVQVLQMRLAAEARPSPPRAAVTATAAATAGAVLLAAALSWSFFGLALALFTTALLPWLLTSGVGAYSGYANWTAAWGIAILAVAAGVVHRARPPGRASGTALALAMAAIALVAQGWLLGHPSMVLADTRFHAHRLSDVMAGHFYFTSGAPAGAFPYPIALYLAAWPFVRLAEAGWLLRSVALIAHVAAGLGVFFAMRNRSTPARGLWAMAFFFTIPAGFHALALAYLTNSFGQSLAVLTMSLVAGWPFAKHPRAGAWSVGAAALVTFLSHTGSFVLLAATLGVFVLLGLRRAARDASLVPVGAALGAAFLLSVAIYYGHFGDTYRTLLEREAVAPAALAPPVMRLEAHQTPFAPGLAALEVSLAEVPRYVLRYFGWWSPLLAAAGALVVRRMAPGPGRRAIAAWLLTAWLFFLIGHLTPFDVRYYLWAAPALAMLGSLAMPAGRPRTRLDGLAALGGGVSVLLGLRYWLSWIR